MGNFCCDGYPNDYHYPHPLFRPSKYDLAKGVSPTASCPFPPTMFNNPLANSGTSLSPYSNLGINNYGGDGQPITFEPYPPHLLNCLSNDTSISHVNPIQYPHYEELTTVVLSPPIQPRPPRMRPYIIRASTLTSKKNGPYGDRTQKETWIRSDPALTCDLVLRREELRYDYEMGKGWFGQIILGTASCNTTPIIHDPTIYPQPGDGSSPDPAKAQNSRSPNLMETTVVIKVMKEDASHWEKEYFLYEATLYKNLRHPNLVRLLGYCLETHPYLLVYEYCPLGDMKTYLSNVNHPSVQNLVSKEDSLQNISKHVIIWCREVASALEYLHRKGFVHGDVAIRNVSLSLDRSAKLTDYGLALTLHKEDYFRCGDTAVPIRWLAPDSIERYDGVMIRTNEPVASVDVWSFGVFVWEMLTLARVLPYDTMSDVEVIDFIMNKRIGSEQLLSSVTKSLRIVSAIEDGSSLPVGKDSLVTILKSCLDLDSLLRPNMTQILSRLLLLNTNDYKYT